jgi:hypothetical protein
MRFAVAGLLLAAFALVFAGEAAFAGEAKVTFNNKTEANAYVALCWTEWESGIDANGFASGVFYRGSCGRRYGGGCCPAYKRGKNRKWTFEAENR